MDIYIVTEGHEGTLTMIAGVLHLKSINQLDDWNYILVSESQIELLCKI